MEVRYTTVDYLILSNASSLMASGKSPFERSTYRYSHLLAFLLLPNSFLHCSWGKFLFLRGLICVLLIYNDVVNIFFSYSISVGLCLMPKFFSFLLSPLDDLCPMCIAGIQFWHIPASPLFNSYILSNLSLYLL